MARTLQRRPSPSGSAIESRPRQSAVNLTLAMLAVAAALFGFATYMARRPKEDGVIRWIPYVGIQFVALLLIILTLAHLLSLLTGQPITGRLSR